MSSSSPPNCQLQSPSLQCQSCENPILQNPKILSCLHKFCEICIQAITRKTHNGQNGICCIICGKFCSEDDIDSNIILQDVLNDFSGMVFSPMQNIADNINEPFSCRQCKRPCVTSHCLNCSRDLCDICKSTHLEYAEFQNHQIVPSRRSSDQLQSSDSEGSPRRSSDQLQFDLEIPANNSNPPCAIHPGQFVSKYCTPCKKPLCTMCIKDKHESHDIQTLESALNNVKPDIKSKLQNILSKQDSIKQITAVIDQSVTQTNAVCKHFITKAESDTEKKIAKIKKDLHSLKAAMLKHAKSSMEEADSIKKNLKLAGSNMENIFNLGNNLIESNTETEILFQPETDLLRKITVVSNVPVDSQEANNFVNKATIKPTFIASVFPQENLVGKIQFGNQAVPNKSQDIKVHYVSEKFNRTSSLPSLVPQDMNDYIIQLSRHRDRGDLNTYYGNQNKNNAYPTKTVMSEESYRISNTSLTQVSHSMVPKLIGNFKLKNFYTRLSYFDGHVYCACFSKNCVDVYTKEGEWIRSISCGSIKCPRVLQPLNEQQMLVAGYSGLFTIDSNSGKVQSQVLQGMFRDVHLNGDIIAALEKGPELKQDSIHVLEFHHPHNETSQFTLGQEAAWSVLISDGYIYISSGSYLSATSKIVKYNVNGDQLAEFGLYGRKLPGEMCTPYLCMSDSNGALLVADHLNNRVQVIGQDGNFSIVNGIQAKYPSDVIVIDDLMLVNDLNSINLYQLQM